MKTHYSLEADEAASYRETGSDMCVREHHLPAHGVRAEALLIVSVVSFVLLCLLAGRVIRWEGATHPGALGVMVRAPGPQWRGDATERRESPDDPEPGDERDWEERNRIEVTRMP